jgi:hypothetical protein
MLCEIGNHLFDIFSCFVIFRPVYQSESWFPLKPPKHTFVPFVAKLGIAGTRP